MVEPDLVKPYGGNLVKCLVDKERIAPLKNLASQLVDISLNERQLCDLELIGCGVFSPLKGFMTRPDYESVLDRMRLQDDLLWPLPICLDVPEITAKGLEVGQSVALRDGEGFLLAILNIEDIWAVDKAKEVEKLYGTTDISHPGVNYILNQGGDYYVGGKLEIISLPLHFDYKKLRMQPFEIRQLSQKLGWKKMVGFQTRNVIHRPQFEMTMRAMKQTGANLLLLPITGITKPGDFDYYTRVRCYKKVEQYYPPESCILNLLPMAMRMAGPREAILHAIISKNFGCTHFIVGHDHAIHNHKTAKSKPGSGKGREISDKYGKEIGVEIIPFEELVYLPFEDEYRPIDEVPEGVQTISLSGSDIQERIKSGKKIPEWTTFPKVLEELHLAFPPPRKQGVTVFLTGLSGAGKSTIAKILFSRFLEKGGRPVTLLDGDIVRRNLSAELSFSKEHRDVNVRRIGFVASEITKNRGIAICAPIAPYANTRAEIRHEIERYGGFVEVHVGTPIEVCERRDRKGMYAKARAGLIKGFTGVDDPYEAPESPEVEIDTTDITPDEATHQILLYLGQKGYI